MGKETGEKKKIIVGKRVKALREEQGLTLKELAVKAGISIGFLGDIESGRTKPSLVTLNNLAGALGTTSDYLLGRTDDPRPVEKIIKDIGGWRPGPTVKIPVLGVIRAGEPIYADQNILGWVDVPAEDVKDGEYFFLKVKGDSMIGSRIYPGDKVLVRQQDYVDNGQIAVVLVNNEEATLKRVRHVGDTVILYSDNPAYQPQVYKVDEVRVLGRVVKVEFEL